MYIDAHVHVWTPDTAHYPLAAGFRRDQMQPPSFTPEELWSHAEPCGVDRIVLIQMSFYGWDNSYMLDALARFPGRFGGVAVIDTASPTVQRTMLELAERGVRGFRIYPANSPVERWLDGPGFERMFRTGAEHALAMGCLINPDALPALDRMCERFPDTPVVIDHLCRIGADGVIRDHDVESLCGLARHRNVYVKVSAFYALGRKEEPYDDLAPLIRRVYEAYGPERLMWATDCPFQVVDQSYQASLALVRDRLDFLSEDDKEWMLRGTAQRLFFA